MGIYKYQWAERSPKAQTETETIRILDLSGKIVRQQALPLGSSAKIDVSDLASGVYVVEVSGFAQREKLQVIH
ncbi:MAG: T9SS type A sorting domain-containing protein [Bacteroidota bacterium]